MARRAVADVSAQYAAATERTRTKTTVIAVTYAEFDQRTPELPSGPCLADIPECWRPRQVPGRAIDVGARLDRVRQGPHHRVQPDQPRTASSTVDQRPRGRAVTSSPPLRAGSGPGTPARTAPGSRPTGSSPSPAHSRHRTIGTQSCRRRSRRSRSRGRVRPPVMTQTMSKMRKVPSVVSRTSVNVCGHSSGHVMCRNCWNLLAPSRTAYS